MTYMYVLNKKCATFTNYVIYMAKYIGVHAPCSFHTFSTRSLLLSVLQSLLIFNFSFTTFSSFHAPCSFLIFLLAPGFLPCSLLLFRIFLCSMLLFMIFCAPCSRFCLLFTPLHILWLAPCSFVQNRACSTLRVALYLPMCGECVGSPQNRIFLWGLNSIPTPLNPKMLVPHIGRSIPTSPQ